MQVSVTGRGAYIDVACSDSVIAASWGGLLFALNEGRVAFTGEMHGAVTDTNRQAIWAGPPTAIDMIARTGSPAPGANGATFESLFGDPVLNAVGAVAFNGRLAGPGVTGTNADGIWLGPAGALQLAVRAGTAAPGTNKTFAAVGPSGLNARNQIVFAAQLLDGQGRLDGGSIWAGAPGSLRLVAEGGSPAPGTGGTFIALITQPGINDLGQVVFTGTADRGNGNFINGIWAGTPDALSRVALVGDAAPIGGTVPAHFSFVESPWINNAGQVAFVASVDADDGSFENKLSVWVRDALGLLHLVAREGGTIDVNGQPLTIRVLEVGAEIGFGAGGTGAGRPAPFNDAGQLVFQAYFETDTALFVATVPVPEPGALAGLAGCGLLLGRPSRRRRS